MHKGDSGSAEALGVLLDPPPPSSGSGTVVVHAPSRARGAHVELTTYDLGRYSTNFHTRCTDHRAAGRLVVAAVFPRVPAALYYVTGFGILGRSTQVMVAAGEVVVVDWREDSTPREPRKGHSGPDQPNSNFL